MTTVRDLSKIVDIRTHVKIINSTEYVYADYAPGQMIDKEFRDLEVISVYIDGDVLVIGVKDKEEDISDAKPIEKYII